MTSPSKQFPSFDIENYKKIFECAVCYNAYSDSLKAVVLSCQHDMCHTCALTMFGEMENQNVTKSNQCPLCRKIVMWYKFNPKISSIIDESKVFTTVFKELEKKNAELQALLIEKIRTVASKNAEPCEADCKLFHSEPEGAADKSLSIGQQEVSDTPQVAEQQDVASFSSLGRGGAASEPVVAGRNEIDCVSDLFQAVGHRDDTPFFSAGAALESFSVGRKESPKPVFKYLKDTQPLSTPFFKRAM